MIPKQDPYRIKVNKQKAVGYFNTQEFMEIRPKIYVRIYAGVGSILAWFAVVMQFYLILLNRTAPVGETIIRFFSYFTILTNLMVAITFTVIMANLDTRICRICKRATAISAVTVYILIVGIIYNAILRATWKPEGMQKVVDELLHTVIPVIYLVFWFLFVPKRPLRWVNSVYWLIYPVVYCLFIVIRGLSTGYYPYPFINANALGYHKAFVNGLWVSLFFFTASFLLIGIAKMIARFSDAKKINTRPLYSNE